MKLIEILVFGISLCGVCVCVIGAVVDARCHHCWRWRRRVAPLSLSLLSSFVYRCALDLSSVCVCLRPANQTEARTNIFAGSAIDSRHGIVNIKLCSVHERVDIGPGRPAKRR